MNPASAPARRLHVVLLGRGRVGAALAGQIAVARAGVAARHGVDLVVAGSAGRADGEALLERARRELPEPRLLVDATDADGMAARHAQALASGFHVVSCNKKPLAGPFEEWRRLHEAARAAGRFYLYEVTVGAGLPVLSVIDDLVESGDEVESIEGCVSGTLNFLCVAMERGTPFSKALQDASRRGYTEPDPRQDLAGADAARKAIITARAIGLATEPSDVTAEPLCAVPAGEPASAFVARAADLDVLLAARFAAAAGRGRRLRYVARVAVGACTVGPLEVEADGALGRLSGPENVFAVRTRRYHHHPLVVSGPGAGPEVTAAGALGDILTVVRALARTPGPVAPRDLRRG